MRASLPIGAVASFGVLAVFPAWSPAPPAPAPTRLPLGPSTLSERTVTHTLAPGVTWTRIARGRRSRTDATGPWRVNVVRVARDAGGGRPAVALSNGVVPGRASLRAIARSARALAAVNGGYFSSRRGLDGDPVGALAVGGQLVSEPVAGRPSLLLGRGPTDPPRIASLRFRGSVVAGGRSRLLDGVDRPRGLIPGCGGRGGDRPTQRPSPSLVCSDESELILFTPGYGARTPGSTGGVEAVLRAGVVTARRAGGSSRIPRGGYVLSGSGDAAAFLRARAGPGKRPGVNLTLRAGTGRLRPDALGGIVSGGPRLLDRGRAVTHRSEGGEPPASPVGVRSPRTLAGVRANGDLLLVTIDGRAPGISVGVTLAEAARVMRRLGARDALNLDGGGSTTMTVGDRVVNRPSGRGDARSLSDALVVIPR